MIDLKNVTLIQYNCLDPDVGVNSLLYSSNDINFNRIILFSHIIPTNIVDKIEHISVPKGSYIDSSKFSLYELYKYIDTEFVISIQTDGFIINPHLWNPEFFNYDYIGAPWPDDPHFSDQSGTIHRVGNGGFVLKSKKLLELSRMVSNNDRGDDEVICIWLKKSFEDRGCKFAPVELAMKFSLELPIEECEHNLNNTFGFHGKNYSKQHSYYCNMIKNWNYK